MSNETEQNGGADGPAGAEAPKAEEQPQARQIEDLITQLEKDNKELQDRLLRTAADFDNYKKRVKKELDDSAHKGRDGLLREILPVIDNLERALKHAAADDPLAQGVRMVEKQMLQALEKFGVTRFSAVGQPFDPAVHDAIQQVETDEVAPGTVAQEFSSGYLLAGNRLLRAAMVAVAKAKAEPTEPTEPASEPAPEPALEPKDEG